MSLGEGGSAGMYTQTSYHTHSSKRAFSQLYRKQSLLTELIAQLDFKKFNIWWSLILDIRVLRTLLCVMDH